MGMQMMEAMLKAGVKGEEEERSESPAPSLARRIFAPQSNNKLLDGKTHKMGDMQERFQGMRMACAGAFDETGKGRSPKVKKRIADVWALGEDGWLRLFKKDWHVYMPHNSKRWFMQKGVPLVEYDDGTLVLEGK